MVVENRAGANTIIAANACKGAAPDGYTFCLLTRSTVSINPELYKKLSYDPLKDFEPITNAFFGQQIVILNKNVPVNTLAELVEYSKKNPDKLNFASMGLGGDSHLIMEWLKHATGAKIIHVPYKGFPEAMTSFKANDIQMIALLVGNPDLARQVREGEVKGLLLPGSKRSPLVPDVPTFAESGLERRNHLHSVVRPVRAQRHAGNTSTAQRRLQRHHGEAGLPREFLTSKGLQPAGSKPEVFAKFLVETARSRPNWSRSRREARRVWGVPMHWDNTTLFSDDNPADRAFREEVRAMDRRELPEGLCHRPRPIEPPRAEALAPQALRARLDRAALAEGGRRHGRDADAADHPVRGDEPRRRADTLSARLDFIGPLIIDAGTPEQKAQHLPAILTGDVTWCQGYSEPGSGSDLASLSTRAVLDGDAFVVNGHKTWTTNGHFADWMFALVRTDPAAKPRHAGITMLLIDLKSPGITVRPIRTIRGDAEFAEEFFVDVRVPKENMLGELNGGWRRREQAARLRALHHRPSPQRRRAAQQGQAGGRIFGRDPRSGLSATAWPCSRSICWRSRRSIAMPRTCTDTARPPPDGAGHQDRRRRVGTAGIGVAGRCGRSARRTARTTSRSAIPRSIPAADLFEMRRVTVGSGDGRDPAQHHRQARAQPAVVRPWNCC